jgi:hypothetical protein
MGIWFHIHIITTIDTSKDMWKLAEILPYASVQTMPLRFGWGCRTFQTASHVHGKPIWEFEAPSQVVDGHIASHSHHYHHWRFSIFGKVGWTPTWCKCANHATMLGYGCSTFQTASHVHGIHIWGVCTPSQVVHGHMASHSHCYHHRHFPRFMGVGWNITWCKRTT